MQNKAYFLQLASNNLQFDRKAEDLVFLQRQTRIKYLQLVQLIRIPAKNYNILLLKNRDLRFLVEQLRKQCANNG